MQELIKITVDANKNKAVSAKDLYLFLGYDKGQWSRWAHKNIIDNDFAVENQDWQAFDIVSSSNNGVPTRDFILSLDFAKKLSMLARTEKGEQAREYFINCEKQLVHGFKLPTTYKEALLEIVNQVEANEQLLLQNELQAAELQAAAPHVQYSKKVLQSENAIRTTLIAKELGMSAEKLNDLLHQKRVQYKQNGTWVLYDKYQNKGYTKTITTYFNTNTGGPGTNHLTVWTELGRKFIHELVNEKIKTA